MLPNIHGDIVTTIPIPATAKATDPATTITGWAAYTEYGTPIDPTQTKTVGTAAGYGWLGAKERSTTDATAGLTLTGDRLYDAITAAFTSMDPEPGGNLTAYMYPNDPINMYDLDGHKGWLKRVGRWWGKHSDTVLRGAGLAAFGVCVLASGGACAAVGGLVAAASIANNTAKYRNGQISKRHFFVSTAWDLAGVGGVIASEQHSCSAGV